MAQTRRRFLINLSLVGTAGLVRAPSAPAAEGLLETTTVRISKDLAICEAPLEIAEELLRAEGFTDVRYVDTSTDDLSTAIAQRKVDFALDFPVLFAPGLTSESRSLCWPASISAASNCLRGMMFGRLQI